MRITTCLALVTLVLVGCDEDLGSTNTGDGDLATSAGPDLTGADLTGVVLPDLRSTDIPPAVVPDEHPRIYLNDATTTRLKTAVTGNAGAAKRFVDMVNAQLGYDDADCNLCEPDKCQSYNFRAWHPALLYALTGDAKYSAYAIKMVDDCITAEEATIAGGERPIVANDSYLEIGDMVGDVMLTYDWCFDKLSDTQKQRWIKYSNQAVWNVWHHEDAEWGGKKFEWSGWSVDNPSNNYYYSFLKATLLTGLATSGENDQATDWITMFRTTKIEEQLVPIFTTDLVGGGSREGTGYGVAMAGLFFLYDVWQQSTGQPIAGESPHAEQSLLWLQHAIMPTRDRLAPIGDHARDSTAALFDYHRNYLQVLGFLYDGTVPAQAARSLLAGSSVKEMSQRFMFIYDFLYDPAGKPTSPLSSLYPVYYGSGTGQVFARSTWETDATWLGFSAGPYTESHAHHDQGQLLVYRNEWLLYDGNIDSHSGLQINEEPHNLVRVQNGTSPIRMVEGNTSELLALHDAANVMHVAADVSPAYGNADIDRNQREIVWLKPNVILVFDRAQWMGTAVQQWNSPIDPTLSNNVATFTGMDSKVELRLLAPASTNWSEKTLMSIDSDINKGFHVEASATANAGASFLTVLVIDDAASNVTRSDEGGWIGATLNLTGGGSATVRFNPTAVGASVVLKNGGGTTIVDEMYNATVATLPTLN